MIVITPKPDDCWSMDCPIRNREFSHCQITQSKCPKVTEIGYSCDYIFDYPDDCPAKAGVLVKISGEDILIDRNRGNVK